MHMKGFITFTVFFAPLLAYSRVATAFDLSKLRSCADEQTRAAGYYLAGLDEYNGNYFDIRLAQKPGSMVSVRDIVADETRGGDLYDRLVSMRNTIKKTRTPTK